MPWSCSLLLLASLGVASAQDEDTLDDMVTLVEERFGGRADREDLYRAAMAGFAERLDRLTGSSGNVLLSRREWNERLAWDRGERHGIGIEFTISPGRGLMITDVFPGGPGEAAGLEVGDLVVGVDGLPFTGMPIEQIHSVVQASAEATQARLDVRGEAGVRRVEVRRGAYRVLGVRPGDCAAATCIRLSFFGAGTARALAQRLKEPVNGGLVLDLRDNEGGLIDEVVAAAGLFLEPESVVLSTSRPDGGSDPIRSSRAPIYGGALVVLINRGTSGPAEAFAAALRDHGRAQLVGTATAGVGTLPSFHPLDGDLVLALSDTWMQGPSGLGWTPNGLAPDLMVEAVSAMLSPSGRSVSPDLQRDAGIQLLGQRVQQRPD